MSETVGESGLPWEVTFVENITRARRAADMSQTDLARKVASYGLPFHQQTVQRIEAGERPIRLNEAMVLCEVFTLDFPEALHPKTEERATETLRSDVRYAVRDWEELVTRLADLEEEFTGARQSLINAWESYVSSLQAMAANWETDLAAATNQFADYIWNIEKQLRDLAREAVIPDNAPFLRVFDDYHERHRLKMEASYAASSERNTMRGKSTSSVTGSGADG